MKQARMADSTKIIQLLEEISESLIIIQSSLVPDNQVLVGGILVICVFLVSVLIGTLIYKFSG